MPAAAGELIADCGLKRTAAKLSAQIRGSNHRFGRQKIALTPSEGGAKVGARQVV